jgi:hypothetical protein
MNLVKTIEQYNNDNIFFCEPIKNNIMNDGIFIRLLYSTDIISFNGVYLLINLNNIVCEKFYNKYKCIFDINMHKDIINNVKVIEENILQKYKTNKIPSFKINEQLQNGYIKIFENIENKNHCSLILKISGIWETDITYGLTYKFITIKQ